ncbi:conserved hypothetical protein [Culex quinquefasciatus]|uniref:Uncharacterized protein n=1 Tax=Culex quinquefasciatus TaxID=7176 RepID=B0W7R7_CULQU|nr:conserved hypothetical protein [Culex quinquefasciatus]|eukprot:XP_001844751.1 conserved hypothetical protein [Culex quinquefasciatus]
MYLTEDLPSISALNKIEMSLSVVKSVFRNHPIVKGMVTYSILWPTGSIIQQTMDGKNWRTYNYRQSLNFAIFGTFFVAPSLYGWAIVEQFSYGPLAGTSFFFGMSLLEQKTTKEAVQEVKDKFPDTYKVGVCVWPIIQTINFTLIAEHNRVPFVSICSLLWTTFLAYMKQRPEHSSEDDIVTDGVTMGSPKTIEIEVQRKLAAL